MTPVILIDISDNDNFANFSTTTFAHLPRVGETILADHNGTTFYYDVFQLVHNTIGGGCDIYLTNRRESLGF